jgi:hypothetical protein
LQSILLLFLMLPQFGYVFAQAGADRNGHNVPLAPPMHQYSNEPPSQKYQPPPPPPHASEFTPPPSLGYRDSQKDDPYYEHMPSSYSSQHAPAPPPASSYPPYTQVDPYQSHVEGYRGSEPPYHNHVAMKVYNQMDEPVYRYEDEQRWHGDSENYPHPYHDQRQPYAQDWSDGKLMASLTVFISQTDYLEKINYVDGMDIVESRLTRKVREYSERIAWLDKDFDDAKEEYVPTKKITPAQTPCQF